MDVGTAQHAGARAMSWARSSVDATGARKRERTRRAPAAEEGGLDDGTQGSERLLSYGVPCGRTFLAHTARMHKVGKSVSVALHRRGWHALLAGVISISSPWLFGICRLFIISRRRACFGFAPARMADLLELSLRRDIGA